MRPPWVSTIPLQMARPRPDPAMSRLRSSPSMRRELPEQVRQTLGGLSPTALVGDRDGHVVRPPARRTPLWPTASLGVPGRVGEQVAQHLDDAPPIRHDPAAGPARGRWRRLFLPPSTLERCSWPHLPGSPHPTGTPGRPPARPSRCAPHRAGRRSGHACSRPARQ